MAPSLMRVQIRAMGRRKRSYHPGMIFHLVSRTHRREPWFDEELRTTIVEQIRRMVARTDAHLLAYAVMPNHLHIVLRQGRMELAQVMQPLMRRIALRVQRHHRFEGTVVERRYRDRACTTPDHVRMAIVYTHLNPWRAGLCGDDLAYPWTSHAAYLPDADPAALGVHPETQDRVLELFADRAHLTRGQLCRRYRAVLEWRMREDRYRAALEAGLPAVAPHPPATTAGDRAWPHLFPVNGQDETGIRLPQPDLRDFLMGLLSSFDLDLTIDDLRGQWRPHRIARARARLIRVAAERGFRTGEIARFFGISPQSVSRVKYDGRT